MEILKEITYAKAYNAALAINKSVGNCFNAAATSLDSDIFLLYRNFLLFFHRKFSNWYWEERLHLHCEDTNDLTEALCSDLC